MFLITEVGSNKVHLIKYYYEVLVVYCNMFIIVLLLHYIYFYNISY